MMESRGEPDQGVTHDEGEDESGLIKSVEQESDPGAGQGYTGDTGPDPEGAHPNTTETAPEGDPTVTEPGPGGYAGRDPKTDMPAIPSVPETQDSTLSHDAAPDPDTPEQSGSDT
jgi:hypothetical protein